MTRIGVILAGGASRRMGGKDKGALELGGRRLIDHVVGRFLPQVDRLLVAGPSDYDLALRAIPDRTDGPVGPAAALWAASHWIKENEPQAEGFVTAPVDGPFLPVDLLETLSREGACAIASDDSGDHPTFAYWTMPVLMPVLTALNKGEGAALRGLAKKCNAERVTFPSAKALMNINSPADLARANAMLR